MSAERLTVGIVGASGYTGGELLRLLTQHPHVTISQVTAERNVGKFVHQIHPHLRGQINLRFISNDALQACDVLFLALPHGAAQENIEHYSKLARWIIDLSADFRLRSADDYAATYGHDHHAPDYLERFVYGLPELNRAALANTAYASGVGCNATASFFALWAAVQAGLLTPSQPMIIDLKVGSSEAGSTPTAASHHPARSGIVRPFQLTGHRHEAEVRQALAPCGEFDVRMAITSVELVRGIAAAAHVTLPPNLSDRDLWQDYRAVWKNEPFVRIVHEQTGIHQHPEPRLLAGTNFVDVGWQYDPQTGRTVLLSALDNLGKGAAGTALQCMNLMCGFAENTALNFGGIYP